MKPHKHAELIKAWADGAEIEFYSHDDVWFLVKNPSWESEQEYRIKLEAEPDIVKLLCLLDHGVWFIPNDQFPPNIKATWDGKTGELKSAEVLK